MRMLVLEGTGVVVPDRAIVKIEASEPSHPSPWLPDLLHRSCARGPGRRVLRLANGGGVEVPSEMRMIEGVAILDLPALLDPIGKSVGVIGIAELGDELLLVCDPNLLTEAGGQPT